MRASARLASEQSRHFLWRAQAEPKVMFDLLPWVWQENTKFFANVKPTKMTALPLDDIIAERGHFGKLDMLKLDVQGAIPPWPPTSV